MNFKKTHDNPLFTVWYSAKSRCTNPGNASYRFYHDRGITFCQEWAENFYQFVEDMGPSYQPGLQLDRIDNNKGYSKNNCQWVTASQNNTNRKERIRKPRITQTEINDYIQMRLSGAKLVDISNKWQRSTTHIGKILKSHDINIDLRRK